MARRAIRRLATGAAVAATVGALVVPAAATASTDQYGNSLGFYDASRYTALNCNPSVALLIVRSVSYLGGPAIPSFVKGVAWVDYFGIPVFVSPSFRVVEIAYHSTWGEIWSMPSASETLPGRYTLHVLLTTPLLDFPNPPFILSTVSATATIDPRLNPDCTPIATSASASRATARKPSRHVLARRVNAMRRDWNTRFERPLGRSAMYPKARFCGTAICVQARADGDVERADPTGLGTGSP